MSIRSGNLKNQAEIITSMRANPLLARDVRKMNAASELLAFEERTPSRASHLRTSSGRETSPLRQSSAAVRSLLADMEDTTSKMLTTSRPKSAYPTR